MKDESASSTRKCRQSYDFIIIIIIIIIKAICNAPDPLKKAAVRKYSCPLAVHLICPLDVERRSVKSKLTQR